MRSVVRIKGRPPRGDVSLEVAPVPGSVVSPQNLQRRGLGTGIVG